MLTPESIEINGAALVRTRADHAAALVDVLVTNLEHLRPWMPWATEANATMAVQQERLVNTELAWANGTDYDFLIVAPAHAIVTPASVAGGMSLMTRQGPGVLELGYWLAHRHVGHGLATNAARALTDLALKMPGIERCEIHCDAGNARSAAIPRRLGYILDRVSERDPVTSGDTGRDMVWTMHAQGSGA